MDPWQMSSSMIMGERVDGGVFEYLPETETYIKCRDRRSVLFSICETGWNLENGVFCR